MTLFMVWCDFFQNLDGIFCFKLISFVDADAAFFGAQLRV